MELFDAFKIIEAKKRALINILFLTLIGLTVIFFSSFLVFNGVVIEKAEVIAEENEVLAEKNVELDAENKALKKLIDDGLEKRIDELEAELESLQTQLAEKDEALTICTDEKNDLQNELDQCISDLQEEQKKSQELEEALKTCNDDLESKINELAICENDLDAKNRELSTCKNNLETCKDNLKDKQEELTRCQSELTRERLAGERCQEEKSRLESELATCKNNLRQKDRECDAKLRRLREELEADCLRRIAAQTSNCDEFTQEIETLKARLETCEQQLNNCLENSGARNNCDLEIIVGYSTMKPEKYVDVVKDYLEKYGGRGNFTVRETQVARYLYIKEIKVNKQTKLKFFR